MYVLEGRLPIGGEGYRDFIVSGRSVPELFSARLMNGSDTLVVTATASLGRGTLVNRLRQVEKLAGRSGSLRRIVGLASDNLELLIRAGRFQVATASEARSQALGGSWQVQVVPRPRTKPPVFDIIAKRIREDS
jgi:hypothetical protein